MGGQVQINEKDTVFFLPLDDFTQAGRQQGLSDATFCYTEELFARCYPLDSVTFEACRLNIRWQKLSRRQDSLSCGLYAFPRMGSKCQDKG